MIVDTYGMACELAADSVDTCLMESPQNVPNATVPTPCMMVQYVVSSDDIALTADIFVEDNKVIGGVNFDVNKKIKYIRLSDLPSMEFTVNFAARRLLTSENRMQNARITQVQLGQCDSLGM